MIQYTPAMRDILTSTLVAEIATVSSPARPHISAAWFAFHDPDLIFGIDSRSQKHKNLIANPHIAMLIGNNLQKTQTVTILGHATIISPTDPQFDALFQLLIDKHPPQATFRTSHSRIIRVIPHTALHYTQGGKTVKRTH